MKIKKNKGFTLLELLIVIAILAVLATVAVLVINPNEMLKKGRTAERLSDLKIIEKALQRYAFETGSYPSSGGAWRSECNAWGGLAPNDVISGLVPTYLVKFPTDPKMDKVANTSCYLYKSDGTDYKILDYVVAEYSAADYAKYPDDTDPYRDGGADLCKIDGVAYSAWTRYSQGGACW
jgi:general secretion pathway protein G